MPSAFHTHQTNPLSNFPQAWERAGQVKLLVLDVDGVLTNGQVFLDGEGKEAFKAFDIQDGLGIKLLEQCGIPTAIITGRQSKAVLARCQELGIQHVHVGVENKAIALDKLLSDLSLKRSDCAVMGDDWPDLKMMQRAGFIICPAQAHEAVKAVAHLVTTRAGGNSAVREVCDLILKAQNRYENLLNQARA
ncbi:KdsC family phosphatase [Polynucleobacter sphagniphilus]|jgi:3-deoxy-D-manno-octulosonate 8-phosphate phosphatase (KDO 8-P phosphatase)|uniref:3-deoxy-D-manno-octulosonate 8-phosphate phosphatase KdsC n=1 Tax=Polynucleobacter sphagniphilus TaxID=1743169 RepID=A0AA43S3Z0_9BURK|nr:HAD hydrolase family protein [Polynucleobacter sphagniphilus]MDF9788587.1 3-deoxy-D-manno-octulosonate 8-phosphate phosphatase (KDO 8-P phosphatase) [Polynucleobacter sphagniphilus]MDH6155166.1 3-deoxy-D-manno-octulosonate 8-phosphate phosphatase (KDO 8-P phosphatase) [Polynucleobacter sphagniphilus]MDH6241754.1 3-deoxy-D-manno-octulosonate 8-phosphate phosphatase (KDO 8-P phosphatase) [Polynucleobacter sphagniphilus]MDH6248813.1 3-deoxy-D-manno-octulosonate 8-phosphate phosphatase (KDO 8-P 